MSGIYEAEDFMVSHLKTINEPVTEEHGTFVVIDKDGKYSVIYADNPDQHYTTDYNSSEYKVSVKGKFVLFSKQDCYFLWNKTPISHSRNMIDILATKGDSILIKDRLCKNVWFGKINASEIFSRVCLNYDTKIALFSEDVFIRYDIYDCQIIFKFYDHSNTLIKNSSYWSDFEIHNANIINIHNHVFAALTNRDGSYNIIQIMPDYSIKNKGLLRWLNEEYFKIHIHHAVIYCGEQKIVQYDPEDVMDIRGEFCLYSDFNTERDILSGASENLKHITIRRYTNTSVKIFDKILHCVVSDNTFISKEYDKEIYNIYKIQEYDLQFTTTDNFYKLIPQKKRIIYTMMFIYKYSDLNRLPFEILIHIFRYI